jgi:hypothetical protein
LLLLKFTVEDPVVSDLHLTHHCKVGISFSFRDEGTDALPSFETDTGPAGVVVMEDLNLLSLAF